MIAPETSANQAFWSLGDAHSDLLPDKATTIGNSNS